MKQYFSDFFEVDEKAIEDYGAYNISLLTDLPLFIDPFLLFTSEKKEYQQLHDKIIEYLVFLKDKSSDQNLEEGLLKSWFTFPEVKQNWMGFSASDNRGSGLGLKFAQALYRNLNRLFGNFGVEGITKGSHLEKLCLISKGVGRDNISDFTTNLIKEFLLNYTQTFARNHLDSRYRRTRPISKVSFDYKTESWKGGLFDLPYINGDYIILTPSDILTKDEIWINRPEFVGRFDRIVSAIPDDVLRAQLNNYLQSQLEKKDNPSDREKRQAIEKTIAAYPEVLDYYIHDKEQKGDEAEALSLIKIDESKLLYLRQFSRLKEILIENSDFYSIEDTSYENVWKRLGCIKTAVEEQNANEIFHFENNPLRREDDLSILFRLTWKANPSDDVALQTTEKFSEIITNWKGSTKRLKIILKAAGNTHLHNTLEKTRDVYKPDASQQEYILVIVCFSKEEFNYANFLLNQFKINDKESVIFINAAVVDEDEEGNSAETKEKSQDIFDQGHALIIGVGGNLPETVRDATGLNDILTDPQRAAYPASNVITLVEERADRKSILTSLDELIEKTSKDPNSTVIIYYSGHGGIAKKLNEYVLVPHGFSWKNLKETGITGKEFTEKLQAIKSKKLLVFLDCCHAGGMARIKNLDDLFVKSPAPRDLLSKLSAGSGRVVVASSREDETSLGGSYYSAFTNCLIESLGGKGTRNFDGYAKILDVIQYLLEEVPKSTSDHQHPIINNVTDLTENFPICYYAGGSKEIPGISESNKYPLFDNITAGKRKRLEQQLLELRVNWDDLNEKVKRIRSQLIIEAGVTIKYQLEQEFLSAKSELDKLDSEIEEIEKKLAQKFE